MKKFLLMLALVAFVSTLSIGCGPTEAPKAKEKDKAGEKKPEEKKPEEKKS
jgi:predicted small lipoprotein YifL